MSHRLFTYGEAETLLAKLHGAEAVQRLAFRGRMKHLKRVGIPLDTTVGQGKKQLYSEDHVWQWAFALELEQVNVDPTSIGKIMATYWVDSIRPAYLAASSREEPVWFWMRPRFMDAVGIGSSDLGWAGLEGIGVLMAHRASRLITFNVTVAVTAISEINPIS